MTLDPNDPDSTSSLVSKQNARWRTAFGMTAPGGASSTPSPTQGRPSGISAPGVAETAQRQGAPDREVGSEGGHDQDTLHAAQRDILHAERNAEPAASGEPTVKSAQPTIRRFTGNKRGDRVGPLRFTDDERPRLQEAAAEHGYKGESGFAADIVLAFINGRFTANLPLSEDRRRTHVFRAQVLRQCNRIGVNINQIARALNSDLTPPDIRQRLDELHDLLTLIAETLREPANPQEVRQP
ncbi:MobC family plasmid mobilization relaxosome protein [Streptomyces sp. NPDC058525]|uniref:MobC family plasmid mobilization relaxosome protein n=1 Tax=Streptomyces sp. NPDC058525 TaxID=3346538 RepID=UPI0036695CA0